MTRDQPVLAPKPSALVTVSDSKQPWPRPTISLRLQSFPGLSPPSWRLSRIHALILSSTVR